MHRSKAQDLIDSSPRPVPTRRTSGSGRQPRMQITERERKFIAALLNGAPNLTAAWAIATGQTGDLARKAASRALKHPAVQAALLEEAGRLRALGAARGMQRLVQLVDSARSEYVQTDASKFLVSAAGLGPRSDAPPPSGGPIVINIDLSENIRRGMTPPPGYTGPLPAPSPAAPMIDAQPVAEDQ